MTFCCFVFFKLNCSGHLHRPINNTKSVTRTSNAALRNLRLNLINIYQHFNDCQNETSTSFVCDINLYHFVPLPFNLWFNRSFCAALMKSAEEPFARLRQKGQEVMEEYGHKKCQRKCQAAGLRECLSVVLSGRARTGSSEAGLPCASGEEPVRRPASKRRPGPRGLLSTTATTGHLGHGRGVQVRLDDAGSKRLIIGLGFIQALSRHKHAASSGSCDSGCQEVQFSLYCYSVLLSTNS